MAATTYLALTLGIVAIGLAILILRVAHHRRRNQALALVLFVDGIGWFGLAEAIGALWPAVAGWAQVVARVSLAASPWAYAVFVAATLDVPITRPLRDRRGYATLLAMMIVAPTALFALEGIAWYARIRDVIGLITGPNLIVAFWAFVAALQWLSRAESRRQAVSYTIAFAMRNLALVVLFGGALWAKQDALGAAWFPWFLTTSKALLLVHLAYLTYGILSGQVLTLDDKVRASLQKATVAIVVATVFLTLTEGTEMWLGAESPIMALLAAGIITLAFQPIQGVAERVVSRFLPEDLEAQRLTRAERLDVYRRQLQAAWSDGHLGKKEVAMLQGMRTALEIRNAHAHEIEVEVTGRPLQDHQESTA